MTTEFKHIHLLHMGWSQRRHHLSNGIPRLLDHIVKTHGGPETFAIMLPWYVHPQGTAEFIAARCTPETKISCTGYSYGGQTVANVLPHLLDMCQPAELRVLFIDAVARRFRGPWGWATSRNPWAKIHIPSDLTSVVSYVQDQKWPYGHPILQDGEPIKQIPVPTVHSRMDSHTWVQNAAKQMYAETHDSGERR